MYPQSQKKTSDIALAALHREMVTRVYQLEELAARHLSLSEHVIAAFAELKRRMM